MSAFNLFVYGTLRSTGSAGSRLTGCERIADGRVAGTLYDIGGRYPALVPYGTDVVKGEVWRCPADMLPRLDAYEGVASGLFRRIGAEVETDGGVVACWVYAAGPALSRELTPEHRVRGGSWRASPQGQSAAPGAPPLPPVRNQD